MLSVGVKMLLTSNCNFSWCFLFCGDVRVVLCMVCVPFPLRVAVLGQGERERESAKAIVIFTHSFERCMVAISDANTDILLPACRRLVCAGRCAGGRYP